jgi:CheY-like chemotaxis protein
MSEHSILVVEDDADDAFLVRRAFAKEYPQVKLHFASDGEEAVAYLSREAPPAAALPDIVLLDLKLPRMSGLEVLQWMRATPRLRRLPVVVLTSSRERRDVDAAYDSGANSYLVKPVSADSARSLGSAVGFYWLQLNVPPSPA